MVASEKRAWLVFWGIIFAYVLGAYATYGWVYHRSCAEHGQQYVHQGQVWSAFAETKRVECAVFYGMFWPAFWAETIARETLEPPLW